MSSGRIVIYHELILGDKQVHLRELKSLSFFFLEILSALRFVIDNAPDSELGEKLSQTAIQHTTLVDQT